MRRLFLAPAMLLIIATSTVPVRADDEGCTVILCLSNPAGWAAVGQCVPPVQKALKQMLKGHMPMCSGEAGSMYTRFVDVHDGTSTNSEGVEVIRTKRMIEVGNGTGGVTRVPY
jgi:hypothetical protein